MRFFSASCLVSPSESVEVDWRRDSFRFMMCMKKSGKNKELVGINIFQLQLNMTHESKDFKVCVVVGDKNDDDHVFCWVPESKTLGTSVQEFDAKVEEWDDSLEPLYKWFMSIAETPGIYDGTENDSVMYQHDTFGRAFIPGDGAQFYEDCRYDRLVLLEPEFGGLHMMLCDPKN